MDKLQALDSFWNSFGWDAYDEYSVPDDVTFPYITYHVATGDLDSLVTMYANLFDRSPSWERVSLKSMEIEERLTTMTPPTIKFNHGRLYLTKGSPFTERMEEPGDEYVRRVYININAEYFSSY